MTTMTAPAPTFAPTDQQAEVITHFGTGENLVVQAGAGTGKTSTLKLVAESTRRYGLYCAFNRVTVAEAKGKLPDNIDCRTAHSLAYGAVGWRYKARLAAPRMLSGQIARILGLGPKYVTNEYGERAVLQPAQVAGMVMAGIDTFCNSADDAPSVAHLAPRDGLGDAQNEALAADLLPYMVAAWADLTRPDGRLRFSHDCYLKMWQLSRPVLGYDFILFDEAQDASPVMAAVMASQTCQVVAVGDSQQSIYSFRGCLDALSTFGTANRAFLSQSFRFGDAIAEQANRVLARIPGAELRLRGCPGMEGSVGIVDDPDAVLCRTNATAVSEVLRCQAEGIRVHLVGNCANEVVRFAKAADQLMADGHTAHAELSCFTSWDQVLEYVESDHLGGELRLMVKLVEDYGTDVILDALAPGRMCSEAAADLIVTTAHQAKGREWPAVRLAGDFPTGKDKDGNPVEVADEEWRLLYVAVTRARQRLDISHATLLSGDPA